MDAFATATTTFKASDKVCAALTAMVALWANAPGTKRHAACATCLDNLTTMEILPPLKELLTSAAQGRSNFAL